MSSTISARSQTEEDVDRIFYSIDIDSLVLVASKEGFNIKDFIRMVQTDTSFYQGFKNLRTTSYGFENDIRLFDKKKRLKASFQSSAFQDSDGRCRTMETFNEAVTGNYFKRKKRLRYYTSKLYERLFFTEGKVCESAGEEEGNPKGMEKHVAELKKLIFQPGQKASVPLIGKKTAIFSMKMARYYDFKISSEMVNGKECYVFTAQMKPSIIQNNPNIGVVKYLSTYFEKGSLQIVKRRYLLSNYTMAYNFKVEMNVDMIQKDSLYYPSRIRYNGTWKIPTQKRETALFEINFDFDRSSD